MNRPVVIAMGVSHRDLELAKLWLKWVEFLSNLPGAVPMDVLVVYTHRVKEPPVFQLNGYNMRPMVVRCVDEDEGGYPRSASHLFLRTLESAERRFPGYAVCWCEPDTVPIRPTWFAEIAADYQACGKPFFGAKVGTRFPHCAGNAVYPHNWRELAPSIANVLSAPDYRLWGPGKGQPWDVYCRHETTPQMAESRLWQHDWKERDVRGTRLKDIRPETAIFHQDKAGALIREIAAARYPEFMATLVSPRKFYFMNGHPSRLRAKGVRIRFSYSQWSVSGHRSAVCSDELEDDEASAIATLVGQLGVREIDEAEFLRVTGRGAHTLPGPRARGARTPAKAKENSRYSHPSIFVMLGRYGDICNILPMLKAEADAGRRPTLLVSQHFADILDGVSYVDRIVWDGAYDRLPDALRWLRKEKSVLTPVIAQFHRNPHDKARLTDSYQKEVWRLADRLDQFETRGPLEFDQRDAGREEELVLRIAACAKPLVLVGLESVSSPLSNASAIMAAIVHRFGETHEVVNLADVKAKRIYDLIGLFDEAALLITADTVFLHLARASKVTTIAILNDGWRGSVAEHAFAKVRYSDASPDAIVAAADKAVSLMPRPASPAMASTLTTFVASELTPEELKDIKDANRREVDMIVAAGGKREPVPFYHPKVARVEIDRTEGGTPVRAVSIGLDNDIPGAAIFHVVDVHGSDARHHLAHATWGAAYAEGITPMHFRGGPRNAKDELGDPRPLPFLKDVLWSAIPADATARGGDIIVWTNGDIGLKPGTAAAIRDHVSKHHAASMRRVESNGQGHPGRDLFAFTVDWLHEHWDQIPDYVLGAPAFDLGLVAMIRKFHGLPFSLKSCNEDLAPADMTPGFALHQSHEPEWQVSNMDSVPSVKWNKKLLRAWAKKYAPEIQFSPGGNLK